MTQGSPNDRHTWTTAHGSGAWSGSESVEGGILQRREVAASLKRGTVLHEPDNSH